MKLTNLLNEICKFSAMKATTALSKFLNIPVGMDMKLVEVIDFDDLQLFNDSEKKMVSVFTPIIGNLPGASFFIYDEKAALSLCDVLFHKKEGSSKTMTDMEISALSEVANVVIGNFLTNFAQSLQIDMIMHRSPVFDWAPLKVTLRKRLPELKEKMKEAVLSISFGFEHIKINGLVIVIFSEEKIRNIVDNIYSPSSI